MINILDIPEERLELPSLLKRKGLIGIELGVATGDFSAKLLDTGLFSQLYGVDMYADHHDVAEYLSALQRVGLGRNYWLIRATFLEVLDTFPDDFFDFVYIDGYAHTGEEGGQTLADWFPKVKLGGMLAGHDYDAHWPKVLKSVNLFSMATGQQIMRTRRSRNPGPSDKAMSWATIRTK